MNKTIFVLKLFLDAIRDTIKVCKYFNLIGLNNYYVSLKIFIIKFFYSFEIVRNRNKKKAHSDYCAYKYLIPQNEGYDILKTVEDLDEKGHTQLFSLDNELINKITNIALNSSSFDKKKITHVDNLENLKIRDNEKIDDYVNRLKILDLSRLTSTINLKKDSDLTELLFSEEILRIAQNYLNTKTISVNATFFISNPLVISETEKYKNAQYFHWDNDFTKFFKLYLY